MEALSNSAFELNIRPWVLCGCLAGFRPKKVGRGLCCRKFIRVTPFTQFIYLIQCMEIMASELNSHLIQYMRQCYLALIFNSLKSKEQNSIDSDVIFFMQLIAAILFDAGKNSTFEPGLKLIGDSDDMKETGSNLQYEIPR